MTDLYVLSQIIEEKDHVYGNTSRRVRSPGKENREGDKGERINIFLGISVIDFEFQDASFDQRLRIKGTIIFGPEDIVSFNSTHTINVTIGLTITIQKEKWLSYHFKLIKDSEEASTRIPIGVVAIEQGLICIASIKNYKLEILFQERDFLPGKSANAKTRSNSLTNYNKKIINLVKNYFVSENIKNIVIAGPGSFKTRFVDYLNSEWRNHNKILLIEDISSATISGMYELLDRKTIEKLAGQYQVIEERLIINEFEKRLGQEFEKICYGLNQSLHSAEQGALETVLISDILIRNKNESMKEKINQFMDLIDKTRVKYFIIDNKGESGKIVEKFGGIIGLLRYPLYFEE